MLPFFRPALDVAFHPEEVEDGGTQMKLFLSLALGAKAISDPEGHCPVLAMHGFCLFH